MITYGKATTRPGRITIPVRLAANSDGTGRQRVIGEIQRVISKGWQYVPKGATDPLHFGETLPSVEAVKRSIEGGM